MQSSVVWLLLCHVVCEVHSLDSQTCEAIVPSNTVAKLGEKAELKCRLSSPNIVWTFCPRNGGPRQIVSNNCGLVQSAADSYRVDTASSSCNLVIDKVTPSHLGSYTCQDLSLNDQGHTVELGNTNENLALDKKAIQSSSYPSAIRNEANLAVDGNRDGNYIHGSCSITNNVASLTWWAVDLEQEVAVRRVRITNRGDGFVERLQYFFIGLTNVSPWTSAPNLSNSSVCTYYTGIAPAGFPLDIDCNSNTQPGRYLFVLMKRAEYLTLCEVEAFYK